MQRRNRDGDRDREREVAGRGGGGGGGGSLCVCVCGIPIKHSNTQDYNETKQDTTGAFILSNISKCISSACSDHLQRI